MHSCVSKWGRSVSADLRIRRSQRNTLGQRGSSLINVMVTTGILGIVSLGVTSAIMGSGQQQRNDNIARQATTMAAMFSAVLANENVCMASVRVRGGVFNEVLARDPDGAGPLRPPGIDLSLCIPSMATAGAPGVCDDPQEWFPRQDGTLAPFAEPGQIAPFGLNVRRVYFAYNDEDLDLEDDLTGQLVDVDLDGVGPSLVRQHRGQIIMMVDTVQAGAQTSALGPRIITNSASIIWDHAGAGTLIGCSQQMDAAGMCAAIGCVFRPLESPRCQCGLQTANCPAGSMLMGFTAAGVEICEPVGDDCRYGQVAIGVVNGKPECRLLVDWDYSSWGPCVAGERTRTVRCVASRAMTEYMATLGTTAFQPVIPNFWPAPSAGGANVPLLVADSFCDPTTNVTTHTSKPKDEKPAVTTSCSNFYWRADGWGACTGGCSLPAGQPWTVDASVCGADAGVVIPPGSAVVVNDTIGPVTGSAEFTCSAESVLSVAPISCVGIVPAPACGPANGVVTAVSPAAGDLCTVGVASAVVPDADSFDWTCTSGASVACSAPKPAGACALADVTAEPQCIQDAPVGNQYIRPFPVNALTGPYTNLADCMASWGGLPLPGPGEEYRCLNSGLVPGCYFNYVFKPEEPGCP